ncbi:HNH endonuclease signature motif containing protein [Enterococcus gallinarum]|uniref:HNH endonuclease signature motif containing protein n=1 Tax=Enterococcus gallinarum TaxID=1353 RepID=UPI0040401EA4
MKPKKQCNHAGCVKLVDYDTRFCTQHEQARPKQTYHERKAKDGKYLSFYNSKSWRKASELYRLSNPVCVECLKQNIIRKADVVDHIVEIKDDWNKRLDIDNFQSLCHRHHNAKTKQEQQKRLGRTLKG